MSCFTLKSTPDQQTCVIGNSPGVNYIGTMLTAALTVSPTAALSSLSSSPHETTRFLAFGFGGGSMHGHLVAHFPHMEIESVDIDEQVLRAALKYFAADSFLCEINRLNFSNGPGAVRQSSIISLGDTDQRRLNASISRADRGRCSSRFTLANAWTYLAHLSSTRSNIDQYDYISFDVYDSMASVGDHRRYEGDSNPATDKVMASMMHVKALLRPRTGIAIFYYHKDRHFKRLVQHIMNVFGEQEMVVLETVEAALIVASKERYHHDQSFQTCSSSSVGATDCVNNHSVIQQHPCSDIKHFAREIVDFGKAVGYSQYLQHAFKYALNCNWKQSL